MARSALNSKKKIKPLDMYTDLLIRKLTANSKNVDLSVGSANKLSSSG